MSEDPRTAANGGDLNWFAKDRVPEKFAKPVFELKKGQVSKPFKTEIGWHIVELTDLQPEKPVEFEQVADEIRFHLETERSAETIKQLMKKLRTVANIQLFPEHI
jgi:parvulin-like peptidyl-prolyl isomerase